MRLIGLAGHARSGKDSIADFLVAHRGYVKFSFSDALYREVSAAFHVSEEFLRSADTKDLPSHWLELVACRDNEFIASAAAVLASEIEDGSRTDQNVCTTWLSPRWVLQVWGTEYRRAQNQDYWVNKAREWAFRMSADAKLVNTSVRFNNEAGWVRAAGGFVVHVERPSADGNVGAPGHVSEVPVRPAPGDVLVNNNGTLEDLHAKLGTIFPQQPLKAFA